MNDRWRWEYGPRAVALLIASDGGSPAAVWCTRAIVVLACTPVGRTMSIIPFLEGRAFRPQDVQAMCTALEDVCKALNLGDKAKREREYVAKRIITLAQQGERSAALLRDRMLREMAYGRGGWAAGSQPLHPFSDGRLARKRRK